LLSASTTPWTVEGIRSRPRSIRDAISKHLLPGLVYLFLVPFKELVEVNASLRERISAYRVTPTFPHYRRG
jgi:hypothetical protein